LAGQGNYERNSVKVDNAVAKIAAAMPQSIVMACTLEACAEFVRQIRKRELSPRFNHLSAVDIASLHKELGDLSRGLEVSRVVPLPQAQSVPVVNEYTKALKNFAPKSPSSFLSLEGFIAAKALTEGLKPRAPIPRVRA
jgi:ABC-type branched-subunit amino acid transport system substrate-binding protein